MTLDLITDNQTNLQWRTSLNSSFSNIESLNSDINNKLDNPVKYGLSVYKDNKTLYGYYPSTTETVSGIGGYDGNPVYLEGGSRLTSLTFSNCSYNIMSDPFTITDTSGLTSLETLYFLRCGTYGCSLLDTSGLTALKTLKFSYSKPPVASALPDTSGLTALETLEFANSSGNAFNLADTSGLTALKTFNILSIGGNINFTNTSGLTALETLTFSSCSFGNTFNLLDTSGLNNLQVLNISGCASYGTFNLPPTSQAVGTLRSLVLFNMGTYNRSCKPVELSLIVDALILNGNTGTFRVLSPIGGTTPEQTTLTNKLTTLKNASGWTINVPQLGF